MPGGAGPSIENENIERITVGRFVFGKKPKSKGMLMPAGTSCLP